MTAVTLADFRDRTKVRMHRLLTNITVLSGSRAKNTCFHQKKKKKSSDYGANRENVRAFRKLATHRPQYFALPHERNTLYHTRETAGRVRRRHVRGNTFGRELFLLFAVSGRRPTRRRQSLRTSRSCNTAKPWNAYIYIYI